MSRRSYQPWAVGISAVIVLFLVATITLVIVVSQQDYDLVTSNYYEKDLGYQKRIDAQKRTNALAEKPRLELDRAARVCNLVFPERADYGAITGDLTMYRISDAKHDLLWPIELNGEGRQYVSVSGLQSGQWIFKLRWEEGGLEYYLEERMYLD
jgi:hypothetical protein